MASAQLTDEELFTELKRLGFTPGPVTENTRPVYLKKLKKLREEQQHQRNRAGKGRNGSSVSISISCSGIGGGASGHSVAAAALRTRPRPATDDVKQSNSPRTVVNAKRSETSTKFVLGFSSDESDAEAPQRRADRRDRGSVCLSARPAQEPRRTTGVELNSKSTLSERRRAAAGSSSWSDRYQGKSSLEVSSLEGEDQNLLEAENERTGRILNGSKTAVDFSDSDEDQDDEEEDRDRERRLLSRRTVSKFTSTPYKSVWDSDAGRVKLPGTSSDMAGDEDVRYNDTTPHIRNSIKRSREASENGKSSKNRDDEAALSLGLRSRFSANTLSSNYSANHSNHVGSNHTYSPKSKEPEDELLEQFKRDEVSSTGGFSAHYLSMFLLFAACLFFLLLGFMYLHMRDTGASDNVAVRTHPFGTDFDSSYSHEEKDIILSLLLHLHSHLSEIAGEHECKYLNDPLNRSMSFTDAATFLKAKNNVYEQWMQTSLEWLIKAGEAAGIRLIGNNPLQPVEEVSDISRLESTHPRMSFTCRFRRAFYTVIYRVLLIVAVIGAVCGVIWYMKYKWRREKEETRQMYDMVERIIDELKSHKAASQENSDLQPYLPILHVRDSLVQPQDRKKMMKIWDRAVKFLSVNESRIRTEMQRIGGADFLVWRWLQPQVPNVGSSKIWQGKAFPLDQRNSPPNSLTPCLKIRNMFDPVMEVGENWHLAIQEAILEKCSDNDGIVHIAVDKNSREGCVYVKCLTAEHSGKAFKALHGSWFDGKLVTVKYLRLDRYHQRFPQAVGCNMPLKPSSSSMNTMSRLCNRSSTSSSLAFS